MIFFQILSKQIGKTIYWITVLNSRLSIHFRRMPRTRNCAPRECNVQTGNLEKVSTTLHKQVSRMLSHVGTTMGKPFYCSERSRIARLCEECRVGSFAATTYITEYGITPGVRSPLISGNFEFPEEPPRSVTIHLLPLSPGIPMKVHLAKYRTRQAPSSVK